MWQPDHKYNEYTSTMAFGGGKTRCEGLYQYSYEGSNQSFSYNDGATSYYKSIQKDKDGNLIYYSLSSNDATNNTSIDYRGGEFAVKSIYPAAIAYGGDILKTEAASEPGVSQEDSLSTDLGSGLEENPNSTETEVSADETTTEQTPEEAAEVDPGTPISSEPMPAEPTDADINTYFGADTKITQEIIENGRKYYVIEYSAQIDCNAPYKTLELRAPGAEAAETPDTLKYMQVVDAEDYSVKEMKIYYGEVADGNLISHETYNTVTDDRDFASVQGVFTFEYNVPLREIDWEAINTAAEEDRRNQTEAYLADHALLLPYTTQAGYTNYISFNSWNSTMNVLGDYFAERGFYPAGAAGEGLYNEYVGMTRPSGEVDYPTPVFSTSYSNAEYTETVSASVYENEYSEADLEAYFSASPDTTVTKSNMTVIIDGSTVSATKYRVISHSNWVDADGTEVKNDYVADHVVFTQGSFLYDVMMNSFTGDERGSTSEINVTTLELAALSSADVAERAQLVQLINQVSTEISARY